MTVATVMFTPSFLTTDHVIVCMLINFCTGENFFYIFSLPAINLTLDAATKHWGQCFSSFFFLLASFFLQ